MKTSITHLKPVLPVFKDAFQPAAATAHDRLALAVQQAVKVNGSIFQAVCDAMTAGTSARDVTAIVVSNGGKKGSVSAYTTQVKSVLSAQLPLHWSNDRNRRFSATDLDYHYAVLKIIDGKQVAVSKYNPDKLELAAEHIASIKGPNETVNAVIASMRAVNDPDQQLDETVAGEAVETVESEASEASDTSKPVQMDSDVLALLTKHAQDGVITIESLQLAVAEFNGAAITASIQAQAAATQTETA